MEELYSIDLPKIQKATRNYWIKNIIVIILWLTTFVLIQKKFSYVYSLATFSLVLNFIRKPFYVQSIIYHEHQFIIDYQNAFGFKKKYSLSLKYLDSLKTTKRIFYKKRSQLYLRQFNRRKQIFELIHDETKLQNLEIKATDIINKYSNLKIKTNS